MSDAHQRYRAIQQGLMQALPCRVRSHQAKAIHVLSALICGIVGSNHSHLPRLASKSPSFGVKQDSRLKRFQRWLSNEQVTSERFFLPFAQALLLALAHLPLVFIMDGSTIGRGCLVLMLSVRYRGRALPLAWSVVRGRKGHFPATSHCDLVRQVLPIIPAGADVTFLGDGEFDGTTLQGYLEELNWRYVCRTACNTVLLWGETSQYHLRDLGVERGERLWLSGARVTTARYGPVLVVLVWERAYEQPLYLLSNLAEPQAAIDCYRRRGQIETFFSDQKSRGFRLEKSHIAEPTRLHRLLIAACLAYLWIVSLGSRAIAERVVGWFHRADRCDLSLFQLGLRFLDWLLDTSQPLPNAFCPLSTLALRH